MYKSSIIFGSFIEKMEGLNGKSVLDMGCGSGVISVFAAGKGAESLAVDKNPASVKSSEENACINNLNKSITAIQSDLFANININKKFDFIFFNPPFYDKEPFNDFELAFNAGKDYKVIKEFITQAKEYLMENGKIICIISSDLGFEWTEKIFKENGYGFNLLQITKCFFETFYIFEAFINLH